MATLVITRHILDETLPVTQLLQGKGIDIMDGIHLINSLKDNMMLMRNSVDSYHDMRYDEALQLAGKVGLKEAKPRTHQDDIRVLHRGGSSIFVEGCIYKMQT